MVVRPRPVLFLLLNDLKDTTPSRQGFRIRLVGDLEPSHQVLDLCNQQYESNTLSYIHPERCTKREDELNGKRKIEMPTITLVGATPKVTQKQEEQVADISGEMQLHWAWQRRSLAYDQANLTTFDVLNDWTSFLVRQPYETPPPGYKSPGREDCIRVPTRNCFCYWQRPPGEGLCPKSNVRPLDDLVQQLRSDARVTFLLLPMPMPRGMSAPAPTTPVRKTVEPSLHSPIKVSKSAKKRERNRLKQFERPKTAQATASVPTGVDQAPSKTEHCKFYKLRDMQTHGQHM